MRAESGALEIPRGCVVVALERKDRANMRYDKLDRAGVFL